MADQRIHPNEMTEEQMQESLVRQCEQYGADVNFIAMAGLPLGGGHLAALREHDWVEAEDGHEGYTTLHLSVPALGGAIVFSVDRAALQRALADVPSAPEQA